MELESARRIFREKAERSKRPPNPEEVERERRFDDLHTRFIALNPDREVSGITRRHPKRLLCVAIPESSENANDATDLILEFTYFDDPRTDPRAPKPINQISFQWQNPGMFPGTIEEGLIRRRLHDMPEDTDKKLRLMEQTLDVVEALPMVDGRIHEDYLMETE